MDSIKKDRDDFADRMLLAVNVLNTIGARSYKELFRGHVTYYSVSKKFDVPYELLRRIPLGTKMNKKYIEEQIAIYVGEILDGKHEGHTGQRLQSGRQHRNIMFLKVFSTL